MKTLRLVVCVYLLFAGAARVFPQSQPADAHISGHLTDPSDAGVGGVRVTAQLEIRPMRPCGRRLLRPTEHTICLFRQDATVCISFATLLHRAM
jgi:hypothetical protein